MELTSAEVARLNAQLASETTRYGIDEGGRIQQEIAELQDLTDRYGIDTSAEVAT